MIEEPNENFINRMGDRTGNCYPHLAAQVRDYVTKGLLPTPVVMDTNGGDLEKIDQRRARAKAKKINGNGFGPSLNELARKGLLPTPMSRDYKGAASADYYKKKGRTQANDLPTYFACNTNAGKTSQLNHRFVMEMMGYPPDWCDLPSKPEGTQSSRRSRSKYSKQLKEVSIKEEEGNG